MRLGIPSIPPALGVALWAMSWLRFVVVQRKVKKKTNTAYSKWIESVCVYVVGWVVVFGVLLYVEFEKIHDSVLDIEMGWAGQARAIK